MKHTDTAELVRILRGEESAKRDCYAHGSCECGCDVDWPEDVADEAADRLEALQAVVDKLPLDASGKTLAPGNMPIVLYATGGHPGHLNFDPDVGWIVWGLSPSAPPYEDPPIVPEYTWPKRPKDCYSTKAAALAADAGDGQELEEDITHET